MGNTGPNPEIYLSQYVNGFIFEAGENAWFSELYPAQPEAAWRRSLDDYFFMQTNTVAPQIIIINGNGGAGVEPDGVYREPTVEDMSIHRFLLGTTLLGDGFYEYDLFDARSAPYWFDEYTVDENGIAVKDAKHKGYLGMALSDAMEMKSPSVVIWEEDFEAGSLPPEMEEDGKAYVSKDTADIISGNGSLVIDNPDHSQQAHIQTWTRSDQVVLTPGETFVIDFDWKILETIDGTLQANILGEESAPSGFMVPGIVAGDAGYAHFPLTLGNESDYSLYFMLGNGGGKVAIDNVRITSGGAAPWQRDFENGFVLVNPINRPYTFDASELAGSFHRININRILGSQAPEVNNGQPVTDTLTLEPYGAIILLAEHIDAD